MAGGFGYVGGRLAIQLAERGHAVTLGSRIGRMPPKWLPAANTVVIDWLSDHSLSESCAGQDVIVHAAGMGALESSRDPEAALWLGGEGSVRFARMAAAAGVRRMIYISTAHVYASPLVGTFAETSATTNTHPYATAHRRGEEAVGQAPGLEGIVVRLSNAFGAPVGPGTDCWTLFVNDIVRSAVRSGRIVLRSDPLQERDFIAMGEVCRILCDLVQLPEERTMGRLFNLGSGRAVTLAAMADRVAILVREIVGKSVTIERNTIGGSGAEHLFYSVARLAGTGIAPVGHESTDAELEALIRYCLAEVT